MKVEMEVDLDEFVEELNKWEKTELFEILIKDLFKPSIKYEDIKKLLEETCTIENQYKFNQFMKTL